MWLWPHRISLRFFFGNFLFVRISQKHVSVKLKHLSILKFTFKRSHIRKENHFHKFITTIFCLWRREHWDPTLSTYVWNLNLLSHLLSHLITCHVTSVRVWVQSFFLATKVRTRVHTKLSTIVSIVSNPCVDCTGITTVTFHSIDGSNGGSKPLVQNRSYAVHPKPQTRPESYSGVATDKFGLA